VGRDGVWGYDVRPSKRARNKMAANLRFAARVFGGKCEKGVTHFHKKVTTNRNSPKRAPAREGVAIGGAKRRAVSERGPNSTGS